MLLLAARRRRERGASLPTVLLLILLFAGVVTPISLHINKVSRSRNMLNQIQLQSLAEARIRNHLVGFGDSCGVANAFRQYRDFTVQAPVIDFNISNMVPCLFSKGEEDFLKSVFSEANIRISQISRDENTISRNLEIRMSFKAKVKSSEGIVGRTFSSVKSFRMRALSLSNFGLFFLGGGRPLLSTQGNVLAHVKGYSYYAGNDALGILQIADLKDPRVMFSKTFFARTKALGSAKGDRIDVNTVSQVFTGGIETSTLSSPLMDSFIPNNTYAWDFRTDQSFLQGSPYAVSVPEWKKGVAAASCHDASLRWSASRAGYTDIPTGAGLKSLKATCAYNTTQVPLFFHSRPSANLTVKMGPGDNSVLCGLIAANTVTFQLAQAGDYGFFGNILANRIVIQGPVGAPKPASLYFYNPEDQLIPNVALPPGQNQRGLLTEFKSLASSLAWNYQIPMASGSPFAPRTPEDFLTPCGSGVASYRSEYKPLHELAGFDALVKNNGDKALLVIEEVL